MHFSLFTVLGSMSVMLFLVLKWVRLALALKIVISAEKSFKAAYTLHELGLKV